MKEYLVYRIAHPRRKRMLDRDMLLLRFFKAKRWTCIFLLVVIAVFGVIPFVLLCFTPLSKLEALGCASGLLVVAGAAPATFIWSYFKEHGETFSLAGTSRRLSPEDIASKHDDKGHDIEQVSKAVAIVERVWGEAPMIACRPGSPSKVLREHDRLVAARASEVACIGARYILAAYWQGRSDFFSEEVQQALEWLRDGTAAYAAIHLEEPDPKVASNIETVLDKSLETVRTALGSVPLTNNMAAGMTPEEFLSFTAELAEEA